MERTFGKSIAKHRKARSETQEAAASALNISAQAVSKWENDACLPDAAILPALALHFGVSIDYLFGGEDTGTGGVEKAILKVINNDNPYSSAHDLFMTISAAIANDNEAMQSMVNYRFDGDNAVVMTGGEGGVSIAYERGFGCIVKRKFFECLNLETAQSTRLIFEALALPAAVEILYFLLTRDWLTPPGFDDIKTKLQPAGFSEETLRETLGSLVERGIVQEKESPYAVVGMTYLLMPMSPACELGNAGIVVLLAAAGMQKVSKGYYYIHQSAGKYPVSLD